MRIKKSLMIGVLVGSGLLAAVAYSAGPGGERGAYGWRHAPMMAGPFMRVVHDLNLTADQQKTIDGYLQAARQQRVANEQPRSDLSVLANPGDPNYAAAVTAAKAQAAERIQKLSELQVQIYGVLNADQKARLPQLLAERIAQHEKHRADLKRSVAPAGAG